MIKIIFEAFIEFLDQLYWVGYGVEFEEENPKAFYQQLDKFKKQHIQKRSNMKPYLLWFAWQSMLTISNYQIL